MTVDRERLTAWLERERELAGRGVTRGHESPAQTPVTRTELLPVDWRLLERLGSYGPHGIWPAVPELARKLGVSDRTVQRSLARLEAAGRVERVAVFERDEDPEWLKRGRPISHARRQTSNTYRLAVGARLAATPHAACEQDGTPRVTGPGDATFDRLSRVSAAHTPVTQPETDSSRVTPGTRVSSSSGACRSCRYRGPPEPIEIPIEPPRSALLDHHPGVSEVLGAIRRRFGEVLVLSGPASYRTAHRRMIDLATESVSDLREAVDQLSRDTCLDGGCRPRQPCRRHRRRTYARRQD
jgi:MarR family